MSHSGPNFLDTQKVPVAHIEIEGIKYPVAGLTWAAPQGLNDKCASGTLHMQDNTPGLRPGAMATVYLTNGEFCIIFPYGLPEKSKVTVPYRVHCGDATGK